MLQPEAVNALLLRHLSEHGLLPKNPEDMSWIIGNSKLGGRGMFATRDIEQGELIYVDAPLVVGPRCYDKYLPMCITCYKSDCPLFPCERGCGLPVCSNECEDNWKHAEIECEYLRSWKPKCGSMWSMELLQAVVPIRALALGTEQRNLVNALECHPRKSRELELLKRNIEYEINGEDEKLMLRVCQVLDTGAFETAALVEEKMSISLRGLYPLGALQNHCCTPNTRHHFDRRQYLYTRAAFPIKKGEELTMTYTDLIWDTGMRKQYLKMSKHFDCYCERCSDRTEFGTHLSALRCANIKCFGNMFANEPLKPESSWTCEDCEQKVSGRQVKAIRSGLASIVKETLYKAPREILEFVEGELAILVPATSSMMMDMKFRIVSYFGRADGLSWRDLSDAELRTKTKYCEELVHLLDNLGCGDCQKKGLILYEWYCTNVEIERRNCRDKDPDSTLEQPDSRDYGSNSFILQKAVDILRDDIAAPDDLSLIKTAD
ncbi:SET domain-containing protein SmydA-8-like [Venturia canescens]|uniref:SET domain-containing protein SmydA-8-like n=1 Tax=Venturia canescens TaxID=32260 RepID=UPI001C9C8397|nr:SET domain-containing protein SmydA-8-like [Venturia canescens]